MTDCFVYVLGTRDKTRHLTYVGWTNDLDKRIARHNAGTGARSTRGRSWVLLHTESFATKQEAMSREWHLKRDRAFRKELAKKLAKAIAKPAVKKRPVRRAPQKQNRRADPAI
jgi:putative endonuclease